MSLTRQPLLPGQGISSPSSNLTQLAAAKFVEAHGGEALRILTERAELAEELGHKIGAQTWREMIEVVEQLLGAERSTLSRLPLPPLWFDFEAAYRVRN
jgi:hypothetical protein